MQEHSVTAHTEQLASTEYRSWLLISLKGTAKEFVSCELIEWHCKIENVKIGTENHTNVYNEALEMY